MKSILKIILLSLLNLGIWNYVKGQSAKVEQSRDFYIRIDTLDAKLKRFKVDDGKISFISIAINNGIHDEKGYHTGYNGYKVILLDRKKLAQENVISYYDFNKFLIRDFYNLVMFTNIYFVFSEVANGYLAIQVRPVGYLKE